VVDERSSNSPRFSTHYFGTLGDDDDGVFVGFFGEDIAGRD